jgi:hypothetical protein
MIVLIIYFFLKNFISFNSVGSLTCLAVFGIFVLHSMRDDGKQLLRNSIVKRAVHHINAQPYLGEVGDF